MANIFYGKNRGQTQYQVTEGAATGATDIEVRIDTTKFVGSGKGSKEEALRSLEEIKNYIMTDLEKIWGE